MINNIFFLYKRCKEIILKAITSEFNFRHLKSIQEIRCQGQYNFDVLNANLNYIQIK